VVNSHSHFDHAGGNKVCGPAWRPSPRSTTPTSSTRMTPAPTATGWRRRRSTA